MCIGVPHKPIDHKLLEGVSLVEFYVIYPVFIACQVKLSQVLLCAFSMCDINHLNLVTSHCLLILSETSVRCVCGCAPKVYQKLVFTMCMGVPLKVYQKLVFIVCVGVPQKSIRN